VTPLAWYERYSRRIEESRLPKDKAEREAYAHGAPSGLWCAVKPHCRLWESVAWAALARFERLYLAGL